MAKTLKQALEIKAEAKKAGGVKIIKDLRLLFPTMGEVSQKVVLRTFESEDICVYNINFPKGKDVQMTGEIADKLIRDFPEYFEIVAVNGLLAQIPNEFYEDKGGNRKVKLEVKNGKNVAYTGEGKPVFKSNKPQVKEGSVRTGPLTK